MTHTDSKSRSLHIANSFREVSALLINSLLGGSAAVYQCTEDYRKLVIPPQSAADRRFVRSVNADAFSDLLLVARKDGDAKASILSPHDLSLLIAGGKGQMNTLQASEQPMVMARPLTFGENLLGLVVMQVDPKPIDEGQALRSRAT